MRQNPHKEGASDNMLLVLGQHLLEQIRDHAEQSYPDEAAGLLLGEGDREHRRVVQVLPLDNAREAEARHNRYLLTPQDYLRGEEMAARLGLEVIGVYHSHPDHPNRPSEFDRQWAIPGFSYIIISVQGGKATESRSWRLAEDRSHFIEETLVCENQP